MSSCRRHSRFLRIALVAIPLALGGSPARSQDCAAATSQTALNGCAGEAYAAADRHLNDLYRDLTGRLGGDDARLQRLISAQRAWIAFRDRECAFVASAVAGGSAEAMVLAQCLRAETERRIEAFGSYANCEEGDLACPVPARAEGTSP